MIERSESDLEIIPNGRNVLGTSDTSSDSPDELQGKTYKQKSENL